MSNPTTEQLQALTDIINSRYDEFSVGGGPVFEPVALGQVRLIYGAVEEWEESLDEAVVEDYANARRAAYEQGYRAANRFHEQRAAIMAEHIDSRNGTLSAAMTPNLNGSTTTVAVPESIDDKSGIADDDWCGDDDDAEREEHEDGFGAFNTGDRGPTDESMDFAKTIAKNTSTNIRANAVEGVGLADSFDKPQTAKAITMNKPRTLAEADTSAVDELSAIIAALQKMAVGGNMPSVRYYDQHKPPNLPIWQSIIAKHDIISWGALADMCDLTHQSQRPGRAEERQPQMHGPRAANNIAPSLDQVLAEVKRQSMAGVMPSQSQFDEAKPANWAAATSQVQRLGHSWDALAELAGLKPRPRGPQKVVSNGANP